MNVITILKWVLVIYTLIFAVYMIKDCFAKKDTWTDKSTPILLFIGAITNFLDTLGIGSFATTQALFKFTKTSDDAIMPGTLNVGDTIPVVTEAVLFFSLVDIEVVTLVAMLAAAVVGSVIGASIVTKLDVRMVRLCLGSALVILAVVFIFKQLGMFPIGGEALGLTGIKLVIGVVVNFFLGALMTIGVGLYAPCMALVYALGLNPQAAFPIMMGSCAFLMPSCGIKFVKEGKYDRKASLCLAIGGVIGVFIAYYLVKSLPLTVLTWLIICVMIYTAIMFFRDARKTA